MASLACQKNMERRDYSVNSETG